MSRLAPVFACLALALAACSVDTPAAPAADATPKSEKPATDAKAPIAANAAADAAAKEKAGDDHAGCIYVDGEKADELGCPHEKPEAAHAGEAAEPQGPATGTGHFGSPFKLADATPLSKAIEKGAGEAPVLISGEVEAVCQKKGCWMVVKDGTQSARVLMKDHAFAVPMDCRGKAVKVEGTLASRTFTEEQVKHLAKDGGEDPAKVAGERTEHVLTASGIFIQS